MAASAMSARAHVAPAASSLNAARRGRAPSTAPARRARRVSTTPRASIADLPKDNASVKVLVVGGTGYIGKFVVRELCAQGYDVTAFVREKSGIGGKSGKEDARRTFPDATVKFGSVSDVASIRGDAFGDASLLETLRHSPTDGFFLLEGHLRRLRASAGRRDSPREGGLVGQPRLPRAPHRQGR